MVEEINKLPNVTFLLHDVANKSIKLFMICFDTIVLWFVLFTENKVPKNIFILMKETHGHIVTLQVIIKFVSKHEFEIFS